MLLAAFQQVDSFFPSGAVSFSWGLETLCGRGLVATREDLYGFIRGQLRNRWAGFDRPILVHAHASAGDFEALAELDRRVEAQVLAGEQRDGSRRMGAALLSVHAKLGTPGADAYAGRVRRGDALAHLPVVQGLVWGRLGLDGRVIQLMAAHGLCTGVLGAAVRLSIAGHVDAQRVLADLHPVIEEVLRRDIVAPDAIHGFAPQTEIASMNHETDELRLFAS